LRYFLFTYVCVGASLGLTVSLGNSLQFYLCSQNFLVSGYPRLSDRYLLSVRRLFFRALFWAAVAVPHSRLHSSVYTYYLATVTSLEHSPWHLPRWCGCTTETDQLSHTTKCFRFCSLLATWNWGFSYLQGVSKLDRQSLCCDGATRSTIRLPQSRWRFDAEY